MEEPVSLVGGQKPGCEKQSEQESVLPETILNEVKEAANTDDRPSTPTIETLGSQHTTSKKTKKKKALKTDVAASVEPVSLVSEQRPDHEKQSEQKSVPPQTLPNEEKEAADKDDRPSTPNIETLGSQHTTSKKTNKKKALKTDVAASVEPVSLVSEQKPGCEKQSEQESVLPETLPNEEKEAASQDDRPSTPIQGGCSTFRAFKNNTSVESITFDSNPKINPSSSSTKSRRLHPSAVHLQFTPVLKPGRYRSSLVFAMSSLVLRYLVYVITYIFVLSGLHM